MQQFHKRMVNIDAFETMIAELAIEKKYDSVICGHIHQPQKRIITTDKGNVTYLNSGDWVEHLTALEYRDNDWHIYHYDEASHEGRACTNCQTKTGSNDQRNSYLSPFISTSTCYIKIIRC